MMMLITLVKRAVRPPHPHNRGKYQGCRTCGSLNSVISNKHSVLTRNSGGTASLSAVK